MTKDLLIVFVKTPALGKVKTRLARTIGNEAALDVYLQLIEHTERVTSGLNMDKHIYFSQNISEDYWLNVYKTTQNGADLGERMLNAFEDGFNKAYDKIVLIGSDLPDLNQMLINEAFSLMDKKEVVLGPALDGGYYLIGMNKLIPQMFLDKPWSTPLLMEMTMKDLNMRGYSVSTLQTLNDIDTYEDLINSDFYKSHEVLQEKLK
jgi:rSAM/selenodomain-associated transferase 1